MGEHRVWRAATPSREPRQLPATSVTLDRPS
jgi:hypothetical protein